MNKKIILAFAVALISTTAFGQDLPKEKSEKHIRIKGTNILMVPPASFDVSTNFKGFYNPEYQAAMIMTVEVPGPYSEIANGFNTKTLKPRGMDLKNKKDIKVGTHDGVYIELEQLSNKILFSKHIIIYGNSKSTTIINGVYPKDSIRLGQNIKASVFTIFLDEKTVSNPREALDYTLDENTGSLKFHSVIGNGMLFNRDLKIPTESVDKASLIIDKSFAKVEVADKKAFCLMRLEKFQDSFSVLNQKGVNAIEVDKLKGYELFAVNNTKKSEEAYMVILFKENGGYYLFFGTYLAGSETALNDIRKVIKTFRHKSD
jgi:hypothetical protein